jgi:isocitrate lyase
MMEASAESTGVDKVLMARTEAAAAEQTFGNVDNIPTARINLPMHKEIRSAEVIPETNEQNTS